MVSSGRIQVQLQTYPDITPRQCVHHFRLARTHDDLIAVLVLEQHEIVLFRFEFLLDIGRLGRRSSGSGVGQGGNRLVVRLLSVLLDRRGVKGVRKSRIGLRDWLIGRQRRVQHEIPMDIRHLVVPVLLLLDRFQPIFRRRMIHLDIFHLAITLLHVIQRNLALLSEHDDTHPLQIHHHAPDVRRIVFPLLFLFLGDLDDGRRVRVRIVGGGCRGCEVEGT